MRKIHAFILLAAGSVALSACGGGGVFNRDRPDEMAVQRQAPLIVPPDFQMAPPQPGAPRPIEGSASQKALEALFGGPAPRSDLETSALDKAGGAAPGIRSTVGDENTNAVAKGTVTRDLLAAPQGDGQAARAVIPG
ncbi:hypothetical protein NT2_04_04130 [Caenibius tardaugens NBRC 16725]|uniref:DUF3035 domain-containing protein n=1 Tax=Caenibius tardaugens NBRC 16725 TaxID=1219035 RepID=U2YKC8_9SPHN|nr:DUF3035 domain-containing protein [Caenibius tardaugens]AZI35947.1 DUF3035 domain-containing protein [Caenibius tardaugens NBRC 16725]GAD49000.1 hypothetical protein NT2_04_04130 [Caenibius tardaugens NBRC 16725]